MKKNIFIASPISCFNSIKEYQSSKVFIDDIITTIQNLDNYSVFSATTNIKSDIDYDTPQDSAKEDFEKLKNATHFILYYPKKVISSSLIELGYAIGQNKKILIFAQDKQTLPYMVQELHTLVKSVNTIYLKNSQESLNMKDLLLEFLK